MDIFTKNKIMIRFLFPLITLLMACDTQKVSVEIDLDKEKEKIHSIMGDWHQAASVADEDIFFSTMTEDAIYLGTDKSERWDKASFMAWSAKIFERDTAWAFKAHDRHIYFSKNGETAWFEESLDTWMGPCRGSGVLVPEGNQWKLAHYNLAMCIDNDDVKEVLEIIQPDSVSAN